MLCPAPDKKRFAGRVEALRVAARIRVDLRAGRREVYECACGGWHLTSGRSLGARIRSELGR